MRHYHKQNHDGLDGFCKLKSTKVNFVNICFSSQSIPFTSLILFKIKWDCQAGRLINTITMTDHKYYKHLINSLCYSLVQLHWMQRMQVHVDYLTIGDIFEHKTAVAIPLWDNELMVTWIIGPWCPHIVSYNNVALSAVAFLIVTIYFSVEPGYSSFHEKIKCCEDITKAVVFPHLCMDADLSK